MWALVFCGMLVFAGIAASYVYYDLKCGVPTYPTSLAVRRAIVACLQADAARYAARGDTAQPYHVVDLGSGSGQLCRHIARRLPQAQVAGVELSIVPWARSALRQKLFGPNNVAFHRGDFWGFDCRAQQAVVVYLLGPVMAKMSHKLQAELAPGTLVISNRFPLPAPWQPFETIVVPGLLENTLYVYRVGAGASV
jgi:SAM-dependent methyltransferase